MRYRKIRTIEFDSVRVKTGVKNQYLGIGEIVLDIDDVFSAHTSVLPVYMDGKLEKIEGTVISFRSSSDKLFTPLTTSEWLDLFDGREL